MKVLERYFFLLLISVLFQVKGFVPPCKTLQKRTRPLHATLTAAKKQQVQEPPSLLLHNGVTASFMPKWPSILSYTLVKGWTRETRKHFQQAVQCVVENNPILTGKVVVKRPSLWKRIKRIFRRSQKNMFELSVKPGQFMLGEHSFVTFEKPGEDIAIPSLKDLNQTQGLAFIENTIIPLLQLKCESVGTQAKKGKPLFDIRVVELPEDHACVAIKMSHCLGDGIVYCGLFEQLLHFLNYFHNTPDATIPGAPLPKEINWNHPLKASFELYPNTFSPRDVRRSYGGPFYFGLLRGIKRLIRPKPIQVYVLSRENINAKKKEFSEHYPEGTRISANDLISAALCQSTRSTDMFYFVLNMRTRHEVDVHDPNAAGYFCWEVPFPVSAVQEPIGMRRIVKKGRYYETNEIPLKPFLKGKVGRITNWASIAPTIVFRQGHKVGFDVVCHCAPTTFFEILPLDVGVAYQLDETHIVVMHNFAKFEESPLLRDMTVAHLEI